MEMMNASLRSTDAVRSPSKNQCEATVRCSKCQALNPREASAKFCDQCGHRLRKHHNAKSSSKHRSSRPKDQEKNPAIENETLEISVTTTSDGGWFWGQQDQLPHVSESQRHDDTEDVHTRGVEYSEEDAVNTGNQTTLQKPLKHRIQKAHTAHPTGQDRRSELARPLRRVQSFGESPSSSLPPIANARQPFPRGSEAKLSLTTAHAKCDVEPAVQFMAVEPSRSRVHLWGHVLAEAIAEFESTGIILTAEIDSDERCISVLAQRLHMEEASRSKYIVASGTSQLQFKHHELEKKVRMNKEKLAMVQQRLSALYEQHKAEEATSGETVSESEARCAPTASATVVSNQDRELDGSPTEVVDGEDTLVPVKRKKSKKKKKKETDKQSETSSSREEQERLERAAVTIQKRFRVLRARRLFAAMVKRAYQRVYDADSKRFFYYNPRTNESQWEVPQALAKAQDIDKLQSRHRRRRPASATSLNAAASRIQALYRRRAARVALHQMLQQVYEKVYDADSNSYYYYCKKTNTSSWEKPKLLRDSDLDSPHQLADTTTIIQLPQEPDAAKRTTAAVKIQALYRNRATRRFLRDLASGHIEKHYDEGVGAWYYYNHRTQESFWEQPRHASLHAAMPKPRP